MYEVTFVVDFPSFAALSTDPRVSWMATMSMSRMSLNRTVSLRWAAAGSTHSKARAFHVAAEIVCKPTASDAFPSVLNPLCFLCSLGGELCVDFASIDAQFRGGVEPFDVALFGVGVVLDSPRPLASTCA